jgi:hypothetical protein
MPPRVQKPPPICVCTRLTCVLADGFLYAIACGVDLFESATLDKPIKRTLQTSIGCCPSSDRIARGRSFKLQMPPVIARQRSRIRDYT